MHERSVFTGISSRAWEHPADRGALVALRKLRGFDRLVKAMAGFMNERMVRMELLGSCVRVSPRQFPRAYMLLTDACRTLDAPHVPELFVRADPTLNASCLGIDKPMIVLNSGLLSALDDDELRCIIAHELGHALSGHALYRTLMMSLLQLSQLVSGLPLGYWGLRAIVAGLQEWSRKSELSADRAGLLVTQNPQVSMRALLKLASGGSLEQLDQMEFLQQAREVSQADDVRDSVARVLLVEQESHPLFVERAGELQRWIDSGEYQRTLRGEYPLRVEDAEARMTEEAEAAARSYSDAFSQSEDALTKLARELSDGVTDMSRRIGDFFTR